MYLLFLFFGILRIVAQVSGYHLYNGHIGVERALLDLVANRTLTARPLTLAQVDFPTSREAQISHDYAFKLHSEIIYNHLRRSHFYAIAVLDPGLGLFDRDEINQAKKEGILETLWHTILLHELGVLPQYNDGTPMSFELVGAIAALDFLREQNFTTLDKWKTGDIIESIQLHSDMVLPGRASILAQVAHLGIFADTFGAPLNITQQIWHNETLKAGLIAWPRTGFTAVGDAFLVQERSKPGPHLETLARLYPGFSFSDVLLEPLMVELGQPL